MYKVASDTRQRVLHRGRPGDWVNGQEQLKPEDQLAQMKAGIRVMHQRIAAARGTEKRDLVIQVKQMENDIVAFRDKHGLQRTQHPELPQYFLNCARQILTPGQFEIIMNAAKRDYERAQRRPRHPRDGEI